jgi:hypothetical protein
MIGSVAHASRGNFMETPSLSDLIRINAAPDSPGNLRANRVAHRLKRWRPAELK